MEREIPSKYQKLHGRRNTSRKAAVRSFCLECVGYAESEVKVCTDKDCPLFKWRVSG